MLEMPARHLNLLLLEDMEVDAELIADALRRSGLRFDLQRVERETAFRAALENHRPDAILADWTLPRFSGLAALAIARERHPEIPLIFVTGTMPLATAAETLQSGAVDYVFKQELSTLGLVLSRAIIEAERRIALLENVARLREANARIKETQEQLIQSEKMAALGQLAAGIAHELNSPLAYTKSNLDVLRDYVEALLQIIAAYHAKADAAALERERGFELIRDDAPALVRQSLEGMDRAQRILRDLKGFARREETKEWEPADVNQVLDSAVNLVWNELKYKCEVRKTYGALPPVRCLPTRIHQVFVNLLMNAAQAISDRGTITLITRGAPDKVVVEVHDTGAGIAPEVLPRIFDPFFTTKPKGVGTGLGLSVSSSIVAQHNGRIEVESASGHGTLFRVTLPLAADGAEGGGAP